MTGEPGPDQAGKRRLLALLRDALDLEGEAREAWIDEACADEPEVAQELRRFLAASPVDVLDRDAGELAARLVEDISHVPAGTRIGAWTLQRPLGHGGMGTVYLATREGDGFRQRGALKLVKRGMDSALVLARFRRERQILSQLDHPNIARLLDGGMSQSGAPYFVMEYVEGQTLRQWAESTMPGLDARLAVFLEIGAAVAHAHRHLIVHRDIKPENVLIDADGHARLLDFGIAKLLQGEGAEPEHTAVQQRFLSRAYAAPEQVAGGSTTTATDVYQLGALLFELLSGARFDGAAPGTALSGWLARAQTGAAHSTRAAVPATRLRGDLSIIVARATATDPGRRYASVDQLTEDIERWRDGRPIRARPDSLAYHTKLFLRRNALGVAAAAVALAAVLVGSALALSQARRANAEAASARASQAFMLNVFTRAEPWRNAGRQPTALELAEDALARADTELADEPSARADMYHALARLFSVAGDRRLAVTAAERAVGTLESMRPADPARLFDARIRLARTQYYVGDFARAAAVLDAIEAAPMPKDPARRAELMAARHDLARDRGQRAEALALARAAAAMSSREPPHQRGEAWWHVAQAERQLGNYAEALRALGESNRAHLLDPRHSRAQLVHSALSTWQLIAEAGAPRRAAAAMRPLVARVHGIFGEHETMMWALAILADAERAAGAPEIAARLLESALRIGSADPNVTRLELAPLQLALASARLDLDPRAPVAPLLAAADAAWAESGAAPDPRRWFLGIVAARAAASPRVALDQAWHAGRPQAGRERAQALAWLALAAEAAGQRTEAGERWHELAAELARQGRPQALAALAGTCRDHPSAQPATACGDAELAAVENESGLPEVELRLGQWPAPEQADLAWLEAILSGHATSDAIPPAAAAGEEVDAKPRAGDARRRTGSG